MLYTENPEEHAHMYTCVYTHALTRTHAHSHTHTHTQLLQLINKYTKVVGYKIVTQKLLYFYTLATEIQKLGKQLQLQ